MSWPEIGLGLLTRLLDDCASNVDGALGAGLSVIEPSGPRPVASVGCAVQWDAAQAAGSTGPLMVAAHADQVRVEDPFDLAAFDGLAAPEGAHPTPAAVIAVPGAWVDDARLVTTLYLAGPVTKDALDTLGRYEPLLAHSLGLFEYCGETEMRADQMLSMMQSRRVIEQAKGMVMTRRSVDADEAFSTLAEVSQTQNVKLRALAVALVELVGGGTAEQPADPVAVVVPSGSARAAARALWSRLGAASGPWDDADPLVRGSG